ncbi:uncharacterized protein B4U79_11545, partial [Dinothrombium tinctorium]
SSLIIIVSLFCLLVVFYFNEEENDLAICTDKRMRNNTKLSFALIESNHSKLNESGFPNNIVENIVHYIRWNQPEVDFIFYISIQSVLQNHNPDKIYIHCNCYDLRGKYWNSIRTNEKIVIKYLSIVKRIFGRKVENIFHKADIARINILMTYGGIYLDNDVFVANSFNEYLKYEISLGFEARKGQPLGNQIIVAHKDARFLQFWLNSYHFYDHTQWYFNAGEFPAKTIVQVNPNLVHRTDKFWVDC